MVLGNISESWYHSIGTCQYLFFFTYYTQRYNKIIFHTVWRLWILSLFSLHWLLLQCLYFSNPWLYYKKDIYHYYFILHSSKIMYCDACSFFSLSSKLDHHHQVVTSHLQPNTQPKTNNIIFFRTFKKSLLHPAQPIWPVLIILHSRDHYLNSMIVRWSFALIVTLSFFTGGVISCPLKKDS